MMKPATQFFALLARNKPSGSGTVINLALVLGILIAVCILEMTCDCLVETLLAVLCMLLGSKCIGHNWFCDLIHQSLPVPVVPMASAAPATRAARAAPAPASTSVPWRTPKISVEEGSTDAGDSATATPSGSDSSNDSEKVLKRSPLPVSVRQKQLQHAALQQAAKDGNLREALRLFELAPEKNVQSFNAVLNACLKSSGCAAAEQWFQKMRQVNVTPNQASYAMLIQGWARAGELSLAQRWMEALRRSGGTPNQGCFLAILMALCKKNRMTEAEWTVQEMVRQFPSTRLQGYTVLVDAYAKLGDLEKAETWMRPIDEGGEATVVSYGAILDACAKFPQALKAREWHERMVARGVAPNEHTFTALITALANCGYFKEALQVLQSMTHFGLLGDAVTFSSLLAACAKAREIKCAEHVCHGEVVGV